VPIRFRSTTLCFLFVFGVSLRLFASVTGTLTVGGTEQVSASGLADSGTVTIAVSLLTGSYSEKVSYGQFSTSASVASALAATFSQDCNSPVLAKATGALINFVMKGSATTLISLQLTSTQNSPSAFSGPSFFSGNISVSASGQPAIFSLSPTMGYWGTNVTLTGINFGTLGTVIFNGIPVSYSTANSTSITVPIPNDATSGFVYVTTFGMTSNGVSLTVAGRSSGSSGTASYIPGQPVINSLLMTNGNAGTPVTLSGINFGNSVGTIKFNGVPATPASWTSTTITVPIPAGATSGPVVAVTSSGLISNGVPITLPEADSCPAQ